MPPLSSAADRANRSLKKKNITELERILNQQQSRESRSLSLTKNPQPILQSLGSEGDAVVSFWSFMMVVLLVLWLVYDGASILALWRVCAEKRSSKANPGGGCMAPGSLKTVS